MKFESRNNKSYISGVRVPHKLWKELFHRGTTKQFPFGPPIPFASNYDTGRCYILGVRVPKRLWLALNR